MKRIDFYTARYCGTCRGVKRRLKELSANFSGVNINYLDIDVDKQEFRKNDVDGVPTLIYYIDDSEVRRMSGSLSEEDVLKLIEEGE